MKQVKGATSYELYYSLDGELTWIKFGTVTKTRVIIPNLPLKATVHVRFQALVRKTGLTDPSPSVSIIVI
jgi:hypothetical protein